MEFFGFTLFGSLSGGTLLVVAAVIFVVGLILTIKGGDWFVDSASWFAEATGIPKFVVGATVVSFATTLPELLVSVRAAMNGSAQLAIGNAIGSVTANTTLIMGVSLVAMAGVVSRKSFSLKGGLLLAAIIAASMPTADSQLLVAASSFASDLYKPIIRKNASNKEMLWVSRIIVLVIAVIAYFIASSKGKAAQAIMDLVSNAWGIFGAAFGPVVLFSLFWKRFTYKGAVAGILVGAIVDMLWLWLPVSGGMALTALTGIYEIIPGFILGGIAAIVVTLLDKKPSEEVEAIFARATDNSIDD